MFESAAGEQLSFVLVNAALLALWPVLPGLIIGYARRSLAVRRIRPEFSLRRSEANELDRALRLYDNVRRRLAEIDEQSRLPNNTWRDFFARRAEIRQHYADELEDLDAHAHHLRATIVRLKRRPLRRLSSWVHILSSRFALGRALAAYIAGLALVIAFPLFDQSALGGELTTRVSDLLVWYPHDARLFYANAIAAGFAATAAPLFYFLQRTRLRREYEVEFCTFREFAVVDLDRPGDQAQPDPIDLEPPHQAPPLAGDTDDSCFAVLGLSGAATAEEIKDAYKTLIKQNHPDRVSGMSPAFKELAEAETKKLNAAYRQALLALAPLEPAKSAVPV